MSDARLEEKVSPLLKSNLCQRTEQRKVQVLRDGWMTVISSRKKKQRPHFDTSFLLAKWTRIHFRDWSGKKKKRSVLFALLYSCCRPLVKWVNDRRRSDMDERRRRMEWNKVLVSFLSRFLSLYFVVGVHMCRRRRRRRVARSCKQNCILSSFPSFFSLNSSRLAGCEVKAAPFRM